MPDNGPLVGGDPQRCRFDGRLAHLIGIRDGGACRDPFYDAPTRHLDHIVQRGPGGPTTFANGHGVCVRGNQVREVPDWSSQTAHDGLGHEPHTVRTTTPTGNAHTSRADRSPDHPGARHPIVQRTPLLPSSRMARPDRSVTYATPGLVRHRRPACINSPVTTRRSTGLRSAPRGGRPCRA
jgi:hypothetical protein